MIRVLVVEDSPVVREYLVHILERDATIQVVATACNGLEALEAVARLRPDIVTMDVYMPHMDGLEATRRIMETCPTPIVIVSSSVPAQEVSSTFSAIAAGALAAVPRPLGLGHAGSDESAKEMLDIIKAMAEVKVVRRWPARSTPTAPVPARPLVPGRALKAVAIGASTGGPPVIRSILHGLGSHYPAPVLVVQHIAEGFLEGFARWLGDASPCPVAVASAGQKARPGHVYVGAEGVHMGICPDGTLSLSKAPREHGMRPAVSYLFRSMASALGAEAVGVLLTGMGEDGAQELKEMRDCGAITIAQDRDTSVVFGMPGEAVRLDAATFVLAADRIASALLALARPPTASG